MIFFFLANRAARFIISSRAKHACITRALQGQRDFLLAINLSSLVGVCLDVIQSTSKCIIGVQATDFHRWQSSGFYSWRWIFSSVNYNNVCGWWITTQYLRQIKENSKLNNVGFNKWLEILAGKDLQTKLCKSENVDFKLNSAREMTQHTYIHLHTYILFYCVLR